MASKIIMYHSTPESRLCSIMEIGLVPKNEKVAGIYSSSSNIGKLFFTPNWQLALAYGKTFIKQENIVLLSVDLTDISYHRHILDDGKPYPNEEYVVDCVIAPNKIINIEIWEQFVNDHFEIKHRVKR